MYTKQIINPWLTCFQPQPQAKLRLFCFPYAGGGIQAFREWSNYFSSNIEIYTIQLPGRENRLREPPFNHLPDLINALSQAILPSLSPQSNPEFVFFGYSMGGLIAFELIRDLRRKYNINPVHLFVAAASAPHLPATKPPIYNLPQTEFIQELYRFNGTPKAVLENAELMELLIPTLRADFSVLETYIYQEDTPLACPITALGGLEDKEVEEIELAAWEKHTCGKFSLKMLSGDHFFLHSHREQLLKLIAEELFSKEGFMFS